MLFNSFEFLIFFPVVTILYFLLPHRYRWFHLLVASCVFYMFAIPVYIFILFFTIIIDYVAGILIENSENERKRVFLIISIISNVGVLAFFKYYNFFISNVNDLLHISGGHSNLPLLNILLPIGLSFHTFQAMSYTIEVYRGNQKAERHFGIYALYVMFYPQLVAGPIERPQNILHQFREKKELVYEDVAVGFRLILWGLFKKVVIADRIGKMTDLIFDSPGKYSGVVLSIGAVFFAFQIFCDFSGYSDIALGTARVMGYRLMVNFNRPYNARSVSEFWRKWHISLSTWLSDYVFKPIAVGMRDKGLLGLLTAAMITFLLSGLWHGAAWKYIIWGGLHGLAIVYELLTHNLRDKVLYKFPCGFRIALTKGCTFFYVCFTYIFFRANSTHEAFIIVNKLVYIHAELHRVVATHKIAFLGFPDLINGIMPCVGLIVGLETIHLLENKFKVMSSFNKFPKLFRWTLYYSAMAFILFFGVFENHRFIYFQF